MDEKSTRPEYVEVLVEIPRGSRNKYEYDLKRGMFRLDRVLYSSVHYPMDYGFIMDTHAPDGDHLDALVVVNGPTFPGCIIRTRPIGVLRMTDEKGKDDKILGIPLGDPRLEEISDLSGLSSHWLLEIENFFATYKRLQDAEVQVEGWDDAESAWGVIRDAQQAYAALHPQH